MAKKRLKIKDKQGNVVDYDISAASITIDVEGKSLDVKLSELVDAISRSVKSVTFNGNSPTMSADGNVNLGQQMQADWSQGNSNWPSYIQNKPRLSRVATSGDYNDLDNTPTIPDSAQTDSQMSDTSDAPVKNRVIKAYVDNLISGLVNGAPQALDTLNELSAALGNDSNFAATITQQLANIYTKGEVDAKVADAGKVKSVTINGTKKTPNETTGDVDLGTVVGEKGDKGDTGNVEITDAGDLVTILVNDLNTGGAGNILSAEMGKRLKEHIDYVYDRLQALFTALGEVAFWEGKPTQNTLLPDLDWSNPKHTVTLDLSLTNTIVTHNGVQVADGDTIQVEEFSTLELVVAPASGYAFTSAPTASAGNVTASGNNYTVALTMGTSDVTLAISATCINTNYVTDGLIFHLDGLNKGGTSGKWIDTIGNIEFTLNDATVNTDNVEFAASANSNASHSGSLPFTYRTHTIELVFQSSNTNNDVSVFRPMENEMLGFLLNTSGGVVYHTKTAFGLSANGYTGATRSTDIMQFSLSYASGFQEGVALTVADTDYLGNRDANYVGDNQTAIPFKLYDMRVYNRQLTAEEVAHNLSVDKSRYNF